MSREFILGVFPVSGNLGMLAAISQAPGNYAHCAVMFRRWSLSSNDRGRLIMHRRNLVITDHLVSLNNVCS